MTQGLLQRTPTSELTAREKQILSLVASGLGGRRIAQELFLSHDTVRTHVAHALAKLGARTRAQAVAIAVRRGLID
jgi:DNA-binding CsgD family transcriptional regulator